MEWPYRRFLKAYDAFQRRILCDEWKARKTAHICALHANSNFGGDGSADALTNLEREYDSLIARIWNGPDTEVQEKEDAAWSSPFMRAGRKALASIQPPSMPGESQIGALPAG